MFESKQTKRIIWNNGLVKLDMLNLYVGSIRAVSNTGMSVVWVRHGYLGKYKYEDIIVCGAFLLYLFFV